nr:zinc finger, CCHC-type [Tanacetum cinerariifolium]
VESRKELGDSLKAKDMAEDASSKKFFVIDFTNYKMVDSRLVMKQYNELLGILSRFTLHKMNMDEAMQVSCIIDKLSPFWKDFKHTLKHKKDKITLVELDNHLRIEESLGVHDSDKLKGNNVAGLPIVNMMKHNNFIRYNDNKDISEAYFVQDDDVVWKNLVSSSILNNYGFKQVIESDKFVLFKHEDSGLIGKCECMDTLYFQSVGIIHEMTAPCIPQQNVIFMDTAYGRRWIRRIENYEYAFSCEDLALIRRISFPGYI